MKSHLTLVPTALMSRETWLQYRFSGLGASEFGCVLGLDDYTSSLELFYYKTGDAPKLDIEKMAQFMGNEQEDLLARMWQYWDGTELGMIANYRADRIVRKCQRVNAFVRNPKYPWLYVSLDRKINKHGHRDEGTLELKTINFREADKWAGGLPPKFIPQVNGQMLVPEFEYGEIALLQDGRKFDVLPFERRPVICEEIVDRTKEFWDRVVKARKLVGEKYEAMRTYNQRRVDELNQQIDALAPEPDGSLAYADYLSERFQRASALERRGTATELEIATELARWTGLVKEYQEKQRLCESQLKKSMAEAAVLDFGPDGKVYWTKASNGSRIFRNKLRIAPDDNPL